MFFAVFITHLHKDLFVLLHGAKNYQTVAPMSHLGDDYADGTDWTTLSDEQAGFTKILYNRYLH